MANFITLNQLKQAVQSLLIKINDRFDSIVIPSKVSDLDNDSGFIANGANIVLTGKLTVGADPVNNMDVATKQYVDTSLANVPSTDTTYTISMSNNRITLTPSSGTATYVDLPVYNGGVTDVWQGGNY